MFQSILLCVQPTGSTIAETLHSGIWAPPIARNASTQTLAQICIVAASQETWSSLPAETSHQSVSNSRWPLHLVSSSLSVQHRVRGCAKKKADINDYIRHSLASRQASPLSKVVANRRQTTMASRLNIKKSVSKVCARSRSARALCPTTTCFRRQMS